MRDSHNSHSAAANVADARLRPVSGWRRLLHWSSALLVIVLIGFGKWIADLDLTSPSAISASVWKFSLHKSVGLIVLILTLARLTSMWLGKGFTPSHHGRLEVVAATAVQTYFICALVLLPLSGLAMHVFSSASAPIWLLPSSWLHFSPARPAVVNKAASFHYFIANGLLIMLILHVAGALKHHWLDRDATLLRMLSGRARPANTVDTNEQDVRSSVKIGIRLGVAIVAATSIFALVTQSGHDHDHDHDHSHDHDHATGAKATQANDSAEVVEGRWYSIDDDSELRIKAVQGTDPFEAEFQSFSVVVDEAAPSVPASLSVTIDSASFVSGVSDRDQVVAGSDWLDAKAFAQARYTTVSIEVVDDEIYRGEGTLTIREAEAPVQIKFDYTQHGEIAGARRMTGSAEFDRMAIDLGRGDFSAESAAGKLIKVEFDIVLKRNES